MDWRRLQFFENLVGSRASECPLVPLPCLVRRHSTTDNGLLIRRQFHARNLTVLPAAADQARRDDWAVRWLDGTDGVSSEWMLHQPAVRDAGRQ